MTAHQTDFSKGSVFRNILEVALPMIVAQVLHLLYNIVDRLYLGRIPGTGALALTGVGLCFPIITFISAFSQLFGNGGAPLCSMARGRGDLPEAAKIMGTSFTMLLLTGSVLTVGGLLFYKPALYALGASDATFPFAGEYLQIYLCGTLFVMITLGMNPFINSQGFGRTGMMTVLLGAVVNILLDPLFIFTFGMGIRGAALATVLSQCLSALWVLRFLTGNQAVLRITPAIMRVSPHRLRRIVALGLSNFIMGITSTLVQSVCNVTTQFWGGDLYVGVMTVLNSVREIVLLPLSGLTSGAVPVMSFNYGGRAFDRVKKAIRFVILTGAGYTGLIWLVIFCFPGFFMRLFSNDPVLIKAGVSALRIYFFGFLLMSLHLTGQSVFLALGRARQAIFFSLFRKVIIVTPLTILLPRLWGLGIDGAFWAEPVSNILSGLLCFATMLCTVVRELNAGLTREEAPLKREEL
ncbi:MAG: MATE family efflux transporter [Synergistaceae bacterium]|jgi:putative MATE family efflux protein|nr:MATE family efflux transporter [Synergistaceae bacterium]